MKFSIVFILFFTTTLFGQPESPGYSSSFESSDEEPGTPQRKFDLLRGIEALEITPGSDFRGRQIGRYAEEELRDILPFNGKIPGNQRSVIYLITTGHADLARLPIWDLGDQELTINEMDTLVAGIARTMRNQNFNRYVGITTRGVYQRRMEHVRATTTHPYRRLPLAILNENALNNPARMHAIIRGVFPGQLHEIEARLIRALGGTGELGLNGNTGHLGQPEQGVRGQVEITPSTATPGLVGGRQVVRLNDNRVVALTQEEIPTVWQDIVYVITPPGVQITAPIIDLDLQMITEKQMQLLEARIQIYLNELANTERYVGMARAGVHRDRTPQARAKEHERAGLDAPYRRLPFAITRVNQEQGPVQMHVLLAGVRVEQIAWVEGRLIRLLGGTTVRGWNSNPGYSMVSPSGLVTESTSLRKSNRRDPQDPEGDGPSRPSFSFGTPSRALF
ncbi:MAG: hypothetical protein WCK49_04285 [Myxococcaceae bacterium]